LEALVVLNPSCWEQTPIFLTGHTGFKGSWLTLWLHLLGAKVHGYALDPPTQPSLFEVANISQCLVSDDRNNILDRSALNLALQAAQPHIIFHLAAQPLVRESYRDPVDTFATNVMGTVYLLEALRKLASVQAVVIITTDKVYENREWVYPYREVDSLGGSDPYSASKAAAEVVVASYRSSFFNQDSGSSVAIATARAGHVIGGGDWARDRLIPDCLRSFEKQQPVSLRYPQAIRPWQHVLDPLFGYLLLAEKLMGKASHQYSNAWNFGPNVNDKLSVLQVAEIMASLWGNSAQVKSEAVQNQPHEAKRLRLDITRAHSELSWSPRWSVNRALVATVNWHQAWLQGKAMNAYSFAQIEEYQQTQ
jgi:CDP-glucose 4,6-dehydratase